MEQFHSIYSRTYNFVYLRAKSILQKEDEVQQLMKEVYLQAAAQEIREENLYEWLGKQTYMIGCSKYRKKKVREAELIELENLEYAAQKSIDREKTKEVICEAMEELPDMYQATLYAFYYDHMKMKDLASVMGYSTGAIINRLNYTHKYLSKALENYQEEQKAKVQFSVEAVCGALRDWSAANCLSASVAQNIYASICRELKLQTEPVCGEGELAGANQRMIKSGSDDASLVYAELEAYSVKSRINKRQMAVGAGIIGILLILVLVAVFLLRKPEKEEKPEDDKVSTEQNDGQDTDTDTDADTDGDTETGTETQQPKDESEYIFPNSDTVELTREQLLACTKEELRLARNEIFARHGLIFGVEDLRVYFSSKSWYTPAVAYDDFYNQVQMNAVEQANVNLIIEIEDTMEE